MSVETDEFAAMVRRQIRALGRRVADGDPIELGEFARCQKELDAALTAAVHGQRAAEFSWAEIAAGLGTTRQAAFQRFR